MFLGSLALFLDLFSIFCYVFSLSSLYLREFGGILTSIALRLGSLKSNSAFFCIFLYMRKYINIYTEIHDNLSGGPQMDAPLAPSSSACFFHIGYDIFKAPAWLLGKSRIYTADFVDVHICIKVVIKKI